MKLWIGSTPAIEPKVPLHESRPCEVLASAVYKLMENAQYHSQMLAHTQLEYPKYSRPARRIHLLHWLLQRYGTSLASGRLHAQLCTPSHTAPVQGDRERNMSLIPVSRTSAMLQKVK